jgi:Zn-dependent peptidase ImmA (M78 family)
MERTVDELLKSNNVTQPPVPVDEIARSRGFAIEYSDLDDVSGLLVRHGMACTIGVNRRDPPVRRRFTIAHELAHALLHTGKAVTFDKDFRYNLRSDLSSAGTDIEEIEANFFAASLLMPFRFLAQDERAHSIDVQDESAVRDLARSYGVSAQAMALRVVAVARRASPKAQVRLPF